MKRPYLRVHKSQVRAALGASIPSRAGVRPSSLRRTSWKISLGYSFTRASRGQRPRARCFQTSEGSRPKGSKGTNSFRRFFTAAVTLHTRFAWIMTIQKFRRDRHKTSSGQCPGKDGRDKCLKRLLFLPHTKRPTFSG